MRGRLINKFIAVIARLDTSATADVDAGDGRTGYDDVLQEIRKISDPLHGAVGESARQEMDNLELPCQVEPMSWKDMRMTPDGLDPNSLIKLVFHRKDFEKAGILDNSGLPLIRKGDRLVSIKNRKGDVVQGMDSNIYLVNDVPTSFGLGSIKPNLIVTMWAPRAGGMPV